ncbi:hypothetical protein DNK10_06635 [Pseudomonas daroniae]|nr:hypothetical protein DNK10_06635 [Pseudomonas daroniae]
MLLADYTTRYERGTLQLFVQDALLDGQPSVDLVELNSGAALILSWPVGEGCYEDVALPKLGGREVLCLVRSGLEVVDAETGRKVAVKLL